MTTRISRDAFSNASKKLMNAGWDYRLTMMVDDAKKPGVENFGMLYNKNGREFWLNFKTIDRVDALVATDCIVTANLIARYYEVTSDESSSGRRSHH